LLNEKLNWSLKSMEKLTRQKRQIFSFEKKNIKKKIKKEYNKTITIKLKENKNFYIKMESNKLKKKQKH
jgi:hypothetical protein